MIEQKYEDNAKLLPSGVPLVYRDDAITFEELAGRYHQIYGHYHQNLHKIRLALHRKQVHALESIKTIRYLKKKLARSNIDGAVLYVDAREERNDGYESSDSEYEDEAGLITFIENEGNKNPVSYEAELHFRVSEEILVTVTMTGDETKTPLLEICERFIKMANELLDNELSMDKIQKLEVEYTESGKKEL